MIQVVLNLPNLIALCQNVFEIASLLGSCLVVRLTCYTVLHLSMHFTLVYSVTAKLTASEHFLFRRTEGKKI